VPFEGSSEAIGQLNPLVGIVGHRRGKLLLPTGTSFRRDLDDLHGGYQRLAMPGVPCLGAETTLHASAGGPFRIWRIGRRETIGVAGVLLQAGFQYLNPSFQCLDLRLLLLEHIEQMHDHLGHVERGLFPTGGI
jgi:hypothetical protein